MDDISWKTLLKWMFWGAHPFFLKHPNGPFEHVFPIQNCGFPVSS